MILALAGGVGGARMAAGLAQVLGPDELTVAVNTGDDFDQPRQNLVVQVGVLESGTRRAGQPTAGEAADPLP